MNDKLSKRWYLYVGSPDRQLYASSMFVNFLSGLIHEDTNLKELLYVDMTCDDKRHSIIAYGNELQLSNLTTEELDTWLDVSSIGQVSSIDSDIDIEYIRPIVWLAETCEVCIVSKTISYGRIFKEGKLCYDECPNILDMKKSNYPQIKLNFTIAQASFSNTLLNQSRLKQDLTLWEIQRNDIYQFQLEMDWLDQTDFQHELKMRIKPMTSV